MKRAASDAEAPVTGAPRLRNKPKKPLSAYNIFFRQERPLLLHRHALGESQPDFDDNLEAAQAGKARGSDAVFQAASKTLANRWKALSKEDRTPFDDPAAELTKQYQAEKTAYEEQMMREAREAAREATRSQAAGQLSGYPSSESGNVQEAAVSPTVTHSATGLGAAMSVHRRANLPQQMNHLATLHLPTTTQNRQYHPMAPTNFGGAPIARAAFPSVMHPLQHLGASGFLSRNGFDVATQHLLSQQLPQHSHQQLRQRAQQHAHQQHAHQQLQQQLSQQLLQHQFLTDLSQLQRIHPSLSGRPATSQREHASAFRPPNIQLPQHSLESTLSALLQQPPSAVSATPTSLARVMRELEEFERLLRAPR
jgi:hypothetical protein